MRIAEKKDGVEPVSGSRSAESPWVQMSTAEFGAFEGSLGTEVVEVNGVYWIKVRPLFYRPLLPAHEYMPDSISAPLAARLGGFQYGVTVQNEANSFLNLLLFEKPADYSLESLDYNRKRQVKLASKQFTIRAMTDINEFKTKAYPVYLSFYDRTKYQFGAERRDPEVFSRWADKLFQMPKVLVLGGYREGELGGVSLSFWVGNTVIYATFFCDQESLRLNLSDLMLHTVREAAARVPKLRNIFVGMYKGQKGLDGFYLLRGCKLVRQPAMLRINPLVKFLLMRFRPADYQKLLGNFDTNDAG